ncbi:3-dehydroquinate synthase [Thalassocella blandensis]|nr:3-dehydroquinate synthase [Thalassocella blandensis]
MRSQFSSVSVNKFLLVLGSIALFCIATNWLMGNWLQAFANELAQHLQSFGVIATLVFIGLSSDIVLPVPSSFISIWAVVSLGPVFGFLVIWSGMTASCLLGYLLGAKSQHWLRNTFFQSQDIQSAQNFMQRFGVLSIVLLRAIPVLAEVSVFVAGVSKMHFIQFVSVSALANLGIAALYASASHYLQQQESLVLVFLASITVPVLAYAIYFGIRRSIFNQLANNIPMQQAAQKTASHSRSEVPTEHNTLLPHFNISFQYPLHFTQNAFDPHNLIFADTVKQGRQDISVLFFIDEGVAQGNQQLCDHIQTYCQAHNIIVAADFQILPGGEAIKTQDHMLAMQKTMLDAELDRQSYVCAIGGGAFLDSVGYAAATFHRGVRLIRMPTTVLAQNDAGVGVKNGINAEGVKNLYGTFAVPHAIINDSQFLESLSARDFRAGFAEAIKVALIRDGQFFRWICEHREALRQREAKATEYLIFRCAQLHLNQICFGGDPFEKGSARPLDYGHWSAHKLESLSHHALNHGEAVAIGMVLDALYAVKQNMLDVEDADQIVQLIQDLGFNIYHPSMHQLTDNGQNALLQGLEEFRQHLGGNLSITLLTGLGTAVEVNQIEQESMLLTLDQMRAIR